MLCKCLMCVDFCCEIYNIGYRNIFDKNYQIFTDYCRYGTPIKYFWEITQKFKHLIHNIKTSHLQNVYIDRISQTGYIIFLAYTEKIISLDILFGNLFLVVFINVSWKSAEGYTQSSVYIWYPYIAMFAICCDDLKNLRNLL